MTLQVCLRIPAVNYNQEKFAEILKQERKTVKLLSYKQVTENKIKYMEVLIELYD